MAVSDAQFRQWMRKRGVPRVLIAHLEFAYEAGGTNAVGTVYLANRTFVSGPPNYPTTPHHANIEALSGFEISVDPDALGGMTAIANGRLRLANADNSVGFLLDLATQGQGCHFYIGAPEWDRSDFRFVLTGIVDDMVSTEDMWLDIQIRDARRLLNIGIAGAVVGDLVNQDRRRKPLVFTHSALARSVELVQLSGSALTYCILENYANAAVDRIYDRGESLTDGYTGFSGTNAAITSDGTTITTTTPHLFIVNDVLDPSTTGTLFSGLTAATEYWIAPTGWSTTTFQLSLTKGGSAITGLGLTFAGTTTFTRRKALWRRVGVDGTTQLSGQPLGRLTADVAGYSASQDTSGIAGGPADMIRALLIDYGGVSAGNIHADFDNAGDDYGYLNPTQSTVRVVKDRENLLTVLDDIARVMQIMWGPDYAGVYRAFRLDLSNLAAATPDYELTRDAMDGPATFRNARVNRGTIAIDSEKNDCPLSFAEVADSVVSAGNAERFTADYRWKRSRTLSGTSFSDNWPLYFPTASEAQIEGAFAQTNLDLRDILEEVQDDLKPHIRIVEDVFVDLGWYDLVLGKVIELTYPRYGFESGLNTRVISIAPDYLNDRIGLRLVTRVAPDTTTATHP